MRRRIDPFDLLDLPDFVPRLSRLFARSAIRLFHQTVDDMIESRLRGLHTERADLPQDILTLLICARDPKSGASLTEKEIRANVITLIAAGHESTANAITWALYLLSQSAEWRERVRAEAEQECDHPAETLCDRLVQTRAVIDETLRLYRPLAAISRVAIAADTARGYAHQGLCDDCDRSLCPASPSDVGRNARSVRSSEVFTRRS